MKPAKTQEQLARFLEQYVEHWPSPHPLGFVLSAAMADRYTASDLADDLAKAAGFREIEFGTWLSSPVGEVVELAVASIVPALLPPDVALLVQAVKLAAQAERNRRTGELAKGILAGAVAAAVVVAASKG